MATGRQAVDPPLPCLPLRMTGAASARPHDEPCPSRSRSFVVTPSFQKQFIRDSHCFYQLDAALVTQP